MAKHSETEKEGLLSRALSGDEQAWNELVTSYSSLVYGTAYRAGLSPDEAADLSQTVWITLLERGSAIRDPVAVPKWLAVTTWRMAVRVKTRDRKHVPLPDPLASNEPSVEQLLLQESRATEVRQALNQLPEKCRDLLLGLFDNEKKNYREVAESLGMPMGSIGPTRARCLAQLHALLRKRGFEP